MTIGAVKRHEFFNGVLIFKGIALSYTAFNLARKRTKAPIPTIHCNGIDDDTLGLQAMLNGKRWAFMIVGDAYRAKDGSRGGYSARSGIIKGGVFLISRTLIIKDPANWKLMDNHFILSHSFDQESALFDIKDARFAGCVSGYRVSAQASPREVAQCAD
jgi:hypothetical protein